MVSKQVLSLHGFLLILTSILDSACSAGPLCYQCSHVPHQRDCTRIVECGAHEHCVGKKYITPDGLVYFTSGCESITSCSTRRSVYPSGQLTQRIGSQRIQANGDISLCDVCCDGNYCNIDTCEPNPGMKHRCLYCDDVLHPDECNLSLQCDEDQICYTEEIYVNKEKRYRLGCAHKQSCQQPPSSSSIDPDIALGKRELPHEKYNALRTLPINPTYCAKCCTGENCNRDLCTSKNVSTALELNTPPPLLLCQDFDTSDCAAGLQRDPQNFCLQKAYRYHLCPVTCRSCYGGSIPIGPGSTSAPGTVVVNPTTPSPSSGTSAATSGCVDLPQCVKYKDFFCDPTHPEGQKVCPVSCGTCGGTTPGPVCVDPIPRCRCKILDDLLGLCIDGDEDVKQFCCYYCNEKLGIDKCPDRTCEMAETIEKEKVDKMNITIPCTDV